MRRASYRAGIEWIAANDENGTDLPGNDDAVENASNYPSSLLLADLFGVEPERVGRDVMRKREQWAREDAKERRQ